MVLYRGNLIRSDLRAESPNSYQGGGDIDRNPQPRIHIGPSIVNLSDLFVPTTNPQPDVKKITSCLRKRKMIRDEKTDT